MEETKPDKHCSIDIETLGLCEDCIILSIGAVEFDIEKQTIGNLFYSKVNIEEQHEIANRTININTIRWWITEQSAERQMEFASSFDTPVLKTLTDFKTFIEDNNINTTWANGPGFDNVILKNIFNQYSLEFPIPHSNWNDFKTIRFLRKSLGLPKIKMDEGLKHNALNDAMFQAKVIIDTLSNIKLK